jgi:hypothetical protein
MGSKPSLKEMIVGVLLSTTFIGANAISTISAKLQQKNMSQLSKDGKLMEWGKQDFINENNICFSWADNTADKSSDYHNTWDAAVNSCIGAAYCPNGNPIKVP